VTPGNFLTVNKGAQGPGPLLFVFLMVIVFTFLNSAVVPPAQRGDFSLKPTG